MTDLCHPTAHPEASQTMQNLKHTAWNKHNVNLTRILQSVLHDYFLKLKVTQLCGDSFLHFGRSCEVMNADISFS